MEILLNELSLSGQFVSEDDFVKQGLTPFVTLISTIKEHPGNIILKRQDFWQSKVTARETIHDIFVGKSSRINDEIRKSKTLLAALINEPFWENMRRHNAPDAYEINGTDIFDSSIAEACERDRVIVSFIHTDFSSTNLSVLKNKKKLQIDNLFNSGHYFTVAKNKGLIVAFSLKNASIFTRTSLIEQGQTVFREILTNRYWYLDNLHKSHYEVFDDIGNHIGVADLLGNVDTTKQDPKKTIKI
ncbi:hypothetical protein LJC68_08055 [Bacteroidales bacterium OttesenSCG-928-B11]|nr:hypothetical protein [Bacteroidales bacterium OttesenSCG-928-B11]MDL2326474.1 hypothetical protein [Bacteroidales bacterium OttesenSCG-928-A14]